MKMEPPTVVVTEPGREELLTVQEFADRVRSHPLTIYRLIREGRQAGVVRVGRQIRINVTVALAVTPPRTNV